MNSHKPQINNHKILGNSLKPLQIAISFALLISSSVLVAQDKMAFIALDKLYWQIWLMDVDGQQTEQLTSSPYDKSRLSWYPDNQSLLISGNQGELVKLSLSDKKETPLVISLPQKQNPPNDVVLSPDGRYMAFSQIPVDTIYSKLWLHSLETGKNIAIGRMKGFQHEPIFSSDGQSLYFLSGNNQQTHDIWRYSLSDQSLEQMTHEQLYNLDVSPSKTNALAFSSNRSGNYEIWISDAKGSRALTNNPGLDARPTWSSNEQTIAFESTRSGVVNIWAITPKSQDGARQLTHFKEGARYPLYQPKPLQSEQTSQLPSHLQKVQP
ncbi:MAG: hypothetical protein OQL19_17800 [Gammaproteobacteria bacterium]|nr:hypothetical protein [Gammaproteobacteria bacterium]